VSLVEIGQKSAKLFIQNINMQILWLLFDIDTNWTLMKANNKKIIAKQGQLASLSTPVG